MINARGFAISPTVKEGYILKVSKTVLDVMSRVTGQLPQVFALSQQDITPYGNGLYHINSILQPAIMTSAPVIGLAITTEVAVAGCATGATQLMDVESAARSRWKSPRITQPGPVRFMMLKNLVAWLTCMATCSVSSQKTEFPYPDVVKSVIAE